MDSKLEAHIDEIFQDVPKTDKMVTMINRIKSKANAKYLQIRDQGYSRNVAYNEVDDWIMKAKVIIDEEVGKLTPAEIAAAPKINTEKAGKAVNVASIGDTPAVVVERDEEAVVFAAPQEEAVTYDAPLFTSADASQEGFSSEYVPAEDDASFEAEPVVEEKKAKKEKKVKKDKKEKKEEVEEDEVVVPVKASGKVGKILGALCLVGGVALIVVAVLLLLGII